MLIRICEQNLVDTEGNCQHFKNMKVSQCMVLSLAQKQCCFEQGQGSNKLTLRDLCVCCVCQPGDL